MTIKQIEGTKGYKAFNLQLQCKDLQYEIGKTTVVDGPIKLCERGIHFCLQCNDCFEYYSFNPNQTRVCEVIAEDISEEHEQDSKRVCHKITIIREIEWVEVLKIINVGIANTGRGNSGDSNSGDRNSGDRNSGDRNSGDSNSGDRNSGDSNSGHSNSGYRNSGDRNSGDRNSGDRNSGYSNSGHWNSGDSNSGHWNSANNQTGAFNSQEPEMVMLFNNPIRLSEYKQISFPLWFYFDLTVWVSFNQMTAQEKTDNPHAETRSGYLKRLSYKDAWKLAYDQASEDAHQQVWAIPNFDPVVFEAITGLHMEKKV